MTKNELAYVLTAQNDLTLKQAKEIVKVLFNSMTEALVEGERVIVKDFGSFTVRSYGAYTGRSPWVGENIEVPPKRLPFFKVGGEMRRRLNPGGEDWDEQTDIG